MSDTRKIAVVDVDDTIANLKETMMHTFNGVTGRSLHWSKWGSFNVDDFYGITEEQFFEIMLQHNVIDRLSPHDEAKHVLEQVRERDVRIVIVTARGWHPTGEASTIKWLENHQIPFDEVIAVPLTSCKVDSIKKFGQVHLAVDDNMKHVKAFADSGIVKHTYLYKQPWNVTAPKYITQIDTLHKILESLES